MDSLIYKIVAKSEWSVAERGGVFQGSEIDRIDGYIHFSSADQLQETAAKHFSGMTDLLLVAVDSKSLGADLKWELSRGGALFPHLYAPLKIAEIHSVQDFNWV